jgi:hypothetical protein
MIPRSACGWDRIAPRVSADRVELERKLPISSFMQPLEG